jgi:hypothetical protein|tara:strand:+ start:107 stop:577 length:471 start_codon:yes stop_codon:yes gene_type:complete
MAEQLQVYNPNDGKWYGVGGVVKNGDEDRSKRFISFNGDAITSVSHDRYDYPLTPCDPPLAFTLGENVLASVAEELRPRVTGEHRAPKQGERWVCLATGTREFRNSSSYNRLILSPPATPPKTAEEALAELANEILNGSHPRVLELAEEAHKRTKP